MNTSTRWKQMVDDLRAVGMTLREIGERVGLSTAAVSDLSNGWTSEPRAEAGIALLELHAKRRKDIATARRRRAA